MAEARRRREQEDKDHELAMRLHELSIQEADDEQLACLLAEEEAKAVAANPHGPFEESIPVPPQPSPPRIMCIGDLADVRRTQLARDFRDFRAWDARQPPSAADFAPSAPGSSSNSTTTGSAATQDEELARRLQLQDWEEIHETPQPQEHYWLRGEITEDVAPHHGWLPHRTTPMYDMTAQVEGPESYEALLELGERIGNARESGATNSEIEALPTHVFTEQKPRSPPPAAAAAATPETGSDDAEKECAICKEEFKTGDMLKLLPCCHRFHAACIDQWLRQKRLCPICRIEVTT